VHVAKVDEATHALVVELRKSSDDSIAFAGCQIVCILANADHESGRAYESVSAPRFDPDVAVVCARSTKAASDQKGNGRTVCRHIQSQIGSKSTHIPPAKYDRSSRCG
jgi:hypothetical protein